ncbi:JAB domain-containing protein [Gottfriedia acidiceleris]
MKSAILNNAASINIIHQQPSGDSTPSKQVIELTKRLVEAGKNHWH